MDIVLNGRAVTVDAVTTIAALRARFCPDADMLLLDSAPVTPDTPVPDGAEVTLFRKGAAPDPDTLETLMASRHTPGVHARVKRAHALVCGVGGLGSVAAMALARVGVGTLTLVDHDLVEPSNLNRQDYFVDQLGMPKVDALAATLRRANPFVTVRPVRKKLDAASVEPFLAGVDVVLECFDLPEAKAMLLEAVRASRAKVPLVMASGIGGFDSTTTLALRRVMPGVWVVGDGVTGVRPGRGLMAPRVGAAAAMQANAALRLILGEEP